jgi:hypothetical protein
MENVCDRKVVVQSRPYQRKRCARNGYKAADPSPSGGFSQPEPPFILTNKTYDSGHKAVGA